MIETLYRDHRDRLFAVSWRILHSAEDAREVSQEAFARLLESESVENPKSWLYRTAINLSIDRVRKRRPPPAAPRGEADPDRKALLDQALADLPERQRVVFLLRHEQGMPSIEIAEIFGVAPSTIGVHLTRALRALRKKLERYL